MFWTLHPLKVAAHWNVWVCVHLFVRCRVRGRWGEDTVIMRLLLHTSVAILTQQGQFSTQYFIWKIKRLNIRQCIGLIPYCSIPRSCWLLVTPTPTPWRPLTPWPRPTPAWSTRATWACAPTTSGPRSPASQSARTRNQFQFYTNNINWYKLIQRCCQINFSNSWK